MLGYHKNTQVVKTDLPPLTNEVAKKHLSELQRCETERALRRKDLKRREAHDQLAEQNALWQLYSRDGFSALGYPTMTALIEAVFPKSRSHFYRLLKFARFQMTIIGELGQVKERAVRCFIQQIPEEDWSTVWPIVVKAIQEREYFGKAKEFHQNKIRGPVVEEAVNRYLGKVEQKAEEPIKEDSVSPATMVLIGELFGQWKAGPDGATLTMNEYLQRVLCGDIALPRQAQSVAQNEMGYNPETYDAAPLPARFVGPQYHPDTGDFTFEFYDSEGRLHSAPVSANEVANMSHAAQQTFTFDFNGDFIDSEFGHQKSESGVTLVGLEPEAPFVPTCSMRGETWESPRGDRYVIYQDDSTQDHVIGHRECDYELRSPKRIFRSDLWNWTKVDHQLRVVA